MGFEREVARRDEEEECSVRAALYRRGERSEGKEELGRDRRGGDEACAIGGLECGGTLAMSARVSFERGHGSRI